MQLQPTARPPDGHFRADDPLEASRGAISASFVDLSVDSWIASLRWPIRRARDARVAPEAILSLACRVSKGVGKN